ncbi:hypothetical protein CY34DRAFT_712240 [Suillus luteus UH-Slu-Lm8-n1]|uniref:Uncharacterized protein n=1 Tax=Suillus luteus UH-Slu-Lm8-n1 TaxID=930992 RepID=A0A0D0ANK0_9AGAM|nr:hypothetical protein CY34DRAFT_712240 [Suillus luteus UH-Slu-Lm8-n1]
MTLTGNLLSVRILHNNLPPSQLPFLPRDFEGCFGVRVKNLPRCLELDKSHLV